MASTVQLGPVETVTINSMSTGPRNTVVVGSSACSLQNSCGTRVAVHVSAGTVTAIDCSKDGLTFDGVGFLGGEFLFNPGGIFRITFSVAPAGVFLPILGGGLLVKKVRARV